MTLAEVSKPESGMLGVKVLDQLINLATLFDNALGIQVLGLRIFRGRQVLDDLQDLGLFGCDLVKEADKLLDGKVQEDCVDDPSIPLDVLDRAAASRALGKRSLDVKVDILLSEPLSVPRLLVKVFETCDAIESAHREDVATGKQDQRIFIRIDVLEG